MVSIWLHRGLRRGLATPLGESPGRLYQDEDGHKVAVKYNG
jgi:hypothetical protein